jgi:hypothetical protein
MARVPASERTRNELKDMFAGKTAADRSSLVRQAARLIVEERSGPTRLDSSEGFLRCNSCGSRVIHGGARGATRMRRRRLS